MRMFRVTINGKSQPAENAGGRSLHEYQHSIVERMREAGIRHPMVRVQEYITGGATASPKRDEE
jgi:hypothetical protein